MRYIENLQRNKGKSAAVFGLKETIFGKRKKSQDRVVIKDPETGRDVSSPAEIKRVSLNYLVNLLTSKPPSIKYKDHIDNLRNLHSLRMAEKQVEDMEELPIAVFLKTFDNLSKKPGKKYDFIVKAGEGFKSALFNLLKIVWRTE